VTRAANRNRRWMQGSLVRKLARQERQNESFDADTAWVVEIDAKLTEKQAQSLARSQAIRQRIEQEKQARAKAEAANKAWLSQNDWLWEK